MWQIFFIICTIFSTHIYASNTSNPYDVTAKILNSFRDIKKDGSYSYQFDTSNGIAAQESGVGGYYVSGSSAYYSPEGQLIQLQYTADANGFHPIGDHLPTPPPTPVAILKALEYIRTHPNQEDRQRSRMEINAGELATKQQVIHPPNPRQSQYRPTKF